MSVDHLRYSSLPQQIQKEHFSRLIQADPVLLDALHRGRDLGLPDWWLVSGALYNSVWNALSGRPHGYGIKDIDIVYFEDRDISWEAEDKVIQAGVSVFTGFPLPVEIRNQARVHLWFEKRFKKPYMPLRCASESIERYAAIAHCVGASLENDGRLTIHAPFGLDDIFSFRIQPNRAIDNHETYNIKARRALEHWPELIVQCWGEQG
ncbi:nucleotidyltransferase family protein [Brucella pituitosa]|uniref:Nucleotidyltransferase family protein n=1 Tax=Brucella pituitosa TaxID=571256 RepID=A0ABS3JUG8_9HYPH|nr:nucleotidyltransferase family protein [Brucella pituitosa]MBO1038306.1 nucleotidyltransferase family protein [Brucella pituitosa]